MTSHEMRIYKKLKRKRNNSFRTKHFTKNCHHDDTIFLSLSHTHTVTHKAENESEIRTSFI